MIDQRRKNIQNANFITATLLGHLANALTVDSVDGESLLIDINLDEEERITAGCRYDAAKNEFVLSDIGFCALNYDLDKMPESQREFARRIVEGLGLDWDGHAMSIRAAHSDFAERFYALIRAWHALDAYLQTCAMMEGEV
jgi:hypothetical protein